VCDCKRNQYKIIVIVAVFFFSFLFPVRDEVVAWGVVWDEGFQGLYTPFCAARRGCRVTAVRLKEGVVFSASGQLLAIRIKVGNVDE